MPVRGVVGLDIDRCIILNLCRPSKREQAEKGSEDDNSTNVVSKDMQAFLAKKLSDHLDRSDVA